jgi:hypothetical protein
MNIEFIPAVIALISGMIFGIVGKPSLKLLIIFIACCVLWVIVEVLIKGSLSEAISTITFQSNYSRATYWFWSFFLAFWIVLTRFLFKR